MDSARLPEYPEGAVTWWCSSRSGLLFWLRGIALWRRAKVQHEFSQVLPGPYVLFGESGESESDIPGFHQSPGEKAQVENRLNATHPSLPQ